LNKSLLSDEIREEVTGCSATWQELTKGRSAEVRWLKEITEWTNGYQMTIWFWNQPALRNGEKIMST